MYSSNPSRYRAAIKTESPTPARAPSDRNEACQVGIGFGYKITYWKKYSDAWLPTKDYAQDGCYQKFAQQVPNKQHLKQIDLVHFNSLQNSIFLIL